MKITTYDPFELSDKYEDSKYFKGMRVLKKNRTVRIPRVKKVNGQQI